MRLMKQFYKYSFLSLPASKINILERIKIDIYTQWLIKSNLVIHNVYSHIFYMYKR